MKTLEIKDLHVAVKDEDTQKMKEILTGVNLTVIPVKFMQLWVQMAQENLPCRKPLW